MSENSGFIRELGLFRFERENNIKELERFKDSFAKSLDGFDFTVDEEEMKPVPRKRDNVLVAFLKKIFRRNGSDSFRG